MPNPTSATSPSRPVTGSDRLWDSVVGGDLAFLLARANAVSLGRANAVLAEHGLKVRSYSVLSLAAGDSRPTQRELSEFLRLDPSQIVSLIDELERAGLVSREPDPNDRRANVVVVTEEGRRVHAAARAGAEASERAMFGVLDPDDHSRLESVLRAIATETPPAS